MSAFDKLNMSHKPLTEQIADQISSMITGQKLEIGEKLPNEFELAETLSVGRGTIREAVKLLVSRNVLYIKRGIGTFVASHPGVIEDPWGFAYVKDKYRLAMDLLEMRLLVEPAVAELAAKKATKEDIDEIQALCNEVELQIRSKVNHLETDIKFHNSIAKSTQNQVVQNLIPLINYSIELFVELTENSLDTETIETHRKMADSITVHDPAGAREAMLRHLAYNEERMKKGSINHESIN